jgi:hypothetical protein
MKNDKNLGAINVGAVIVVLAIIVIGVVFYLMQNNSGNTPETNPTPPPPPASMTSAEAPMSAQNNSGQSGKVTLTEVNGQTKVVIEVASGPRGTQQPAYMNLGDCSALGSLKYNLNPVVDGRSETTLQPALHFIHGLGQLTVNVRSSSAPNASVISCGTITDALDRAMNGEINGSIRSEGTLEIQ